VTRAERAERISARLVDLLREERLRQELSMNRLSEMAGLSRQAIKWIEDKERQPALYTLLLIADALEVDLGALISTASKDGDSEEI